MSFLTRALLTEVQRFLSLRRLPQGVRFKVHSCLLALLPQQGLLLPDTPPPNTCLSLLEKVEEGT